MPIQSFYGIRANAFTEQVDNVPTNGTKVYIMNFKNVSTCNWDLRPSQNPGNGGNSPNFILNPVQRPTPSTFAIAQVSTLSSTSTTSSPTNTAASTIATPSNEPKPKPKPKTKGNGAIIAGIAALVLILVLGLASLGFWLYRRQKKQKASEAVIPSFRRLPRDNEGNGKLHFNSNASGDVPTIQSADTLEQYRPQTSFRDAHGLGLQASSIQSTPAHFRFGGLPAPQPCVLSKYNADTVRQLNTSPIELPKTPICRPQELSTTTARDRAVELNAGIAAHEIGPSRMENTGFNFPPEKTAVC